MAVGIDRVARPTSNGSLAGPVISRDTEASQASWRAVAASITAPEPSTALPGLADQHGQRHVGHDVGATEPMGDLGVVLEEVAGDRHQSSRPPLGPPRALLEGEACCAAASSAVATISPPSASSVPSSFTPPRVGVMVTAGTTGGSRAGHGRG